MKISGELFNSYNLVLELDTNDTLTFLGILERAKAFKQETKYRDDSHEYTVEMTPVKTPTVCIQTGE